jgi:hypothetical protein
MAFGAKAAHRCRLRGRRRMHFPSKTPRAQQTDETPRTVLILVEGWPDGAFKFKSLDARVSQLGNGWLIKRREFL